MAPSDNRISFVVRFVTECVEDLRFAHATELARAGLYAAAKALLLPANQTLTEARDLDLLARIEANQHHYAEAQRIWLAAATVSSEPNNYRLLASEAANAGQARFLRKQVVLALTISFVLSGLILSALEISSRPAHAKAHIPSVAPSKVAPQAIPGSSRP
jgi:hypothetical protein